MTLLTWIGIVFCLTQSALFSGMNIGLFSLSKLQLEVEAKRGNAEARKVLALRRDANFALVTILWGNVGVNVLVALLSGSVLTGMAAFLFSTVVITVCAEIIPQAYFTRNALRLAALFSPWLRMYQILLYPVAKPTALALDAWLGGEQIGYFPERNLRRIIQFHVDAPESEIDRVEGRGALNFLEIDDTRLDAEGEMLDPASIVQIEFQEGEPVFPQIAARADDPFLGAIVASGRSWVVLVNAEGTPLRVLRTNGFLREALFHPRNFEPRRHCHRPIVVNDPTTTLGQLIERFRVIGRHAEDDMVDHNVILLWTAEPRIVTGTDILGRLLRGIAAQTPKRPDGGGATEGGNHEAARVNTPKRSA